MKNRSPLALIIFAVFSCGPMNKKPADIQTQNSCNNGISTRQDGNTPPIMFSDSQKFIIQAHLKDNADGNPVQAQVGDNTYIVRLVRAIDLSPISKDAKITIEFSRKNSHFQKKFEAEVQHLGDGTFTTNLTFKKPGDWLIEVHFTDGDIKDDHVETISF